VYQDDVSFRFHPVHGCKEDQMISPHAEEFMAKRMGATVRKVAASHAAMLSHPREVAELITLAAQSIS
jgi:hypothetical protein